LKLKCSKVYNNNGFVTYLVDKVRN